MRDFAEVYVNYRRKIGFISTRFSSTTGVPANDFDSELSEELWNAYKSFDSGKGCSLDTWVNTRLRQRACRYIKSRETKFYRVTGKGSEDSEDTLISEFVEPTLTDGSVLEKKKEADQRQLIDFLLDRANDPVTTLIVTKYAELQNGTMSITALAKALGLHHELVKRKLRALSRYYDANRFGDYHDYLAV